MALALSAWPSALNSWEGASWSTRNPIVALPSAPACPLAKQQGRQRRNAICPERVQDVSAERRFPSTFPPDCHFCQYTAAKRQATVCWWKAVLADYAWEICGELLCLVRNAGRNNRWSIARRLISISRRTATWKSRPSCCSQI